MREPTTTPRRAMRAASIVAAVLLAGTLGTTATARDGGEEDTGSPPSPGVPTAEALADGAGLSRDAGDAERITTGGTTFDPTILTKFIAGTGFSLRQGNDPWADVAEYNSGPGCVQADAGASTAAGEFLELEASVELPDGARIKRIIFFGANNDPARTIRVRLHRVSVRVPNVGGDPTMSIHTVDDFTVVDDPNSFMTVTFGRNDLDDRAGSSSAVGSVRHDFHTVFVRMSNLAGTDHQLCGIEVEYQVPVPADAGTVFHPLDGYRAYDSRFEMAPVADGPLAKGANRVVPVKDGRNVGTGAINLLDAIPATATAVAYTVTVASPASSGFLWVAPGDVAGLNGSSINWDTNTVGALANSGIVKLDAQRRVKVFADGSPGAATHFIIDITGYYAPPVFPNMAG